MIQLKSITKIFPGVRALDNVDFSAQKGEIHALLGENGAGKSTLIKIVAGVYKPDAGQIIYEGKVLVDSFNPDSPGISRVLNVDSFPTEENLA